MPQAVTGSWFPTGFHGHFRSHVRNDVHQEFRKQARPEPPQAFLQRMKEHPTKHIFSKHDNRQIFPSSVFSFENDMGKRKIIKSRESFNFIHWAPLEEELKRQRPLLSTYRTDFWEINDRKERNTPQILVPRLNRLSSASCPRSTAHRNLLRIQPPRQSITIENFNTQTPQQPKSNNMSNVHNYGHFQSTSTGLQRAWSAPQKRLTVSDCLVWPTPENKEEDSFKNKS
ncbi:ciliary microtubule inner protein 7 [Rhinophrynus dorsalis]